MDKKEEKLTTIKPMLKSYVPHRSVFQYKLKRKLVTTLATILFVTPTILMSSKLQTFHPGIISGKDVSIVTKDLDADTAYIGSNVRFIAPKKGPIYVNVNIDNLTDTQKNAITDAISELHDVVNAINPKYSLKVRFNPTKKQMQDLYTINVVKESLNKQDVLGSANPTIAYPTKSGMGVYQVKVKLDNRLLDSEDMKDNYYLLRNVMIHETGGHGLAGLKDAYLLPCYTNPSFMQSATSSKIPFTMNDIKLLSAKLGADSVYRIDLNSIYNQTIPSDEIRKSINLVKKQITPEFLNGYFNTDEFTGKNIQFENIGNVYAMSEHNHLSTVQTESPVKVYKKTITTQLFSINKNHTEFRRNDCSIESNKLGETGKKNVVIDNVIWSESNQVYGKIGNKLLVVTILDVDNSGETGLIVDKLDIISKNEHDGIVKKLRERSKTNYYNDLIVENLNKTQKYIPLSSAEINRQLLTTGKNNYFLNNNIFLAEEPEISCQAINYNGYILTSNNKVIAKKQDGSYEFVEYELSPSNDTFTIDKVTSVRNPRVFTM